ncbi:MAG: cytochrome P450, partial [Rhodospirillaceae bacterium]|nr:cytochrome P450 [Rhodospirillaceae bacterium]
IDTTWSSLGSALLHFATHPEHRRRMATEPDLFPSAIEEMLRVYAPVTMAREVTEEVKVGDVTFQPGDKVLLNFPAANHDPAAFEDADKVILDRKKNRHIAFGVGSHRCAGSNLARMEMDVALRVWFERIPEFQLTDPDAVTWVGGQVRGPRHLPFKF